MTRLRDAQGLRTFVLVARLGSVKAAARRLHYSTSAVWSQIRVLEKHLRTGELVQRRGERLLTRKGRRLEPVAAEAVEKLEKVEEVADLLADDA